MESETLISSYLWYTVVILLSVGLSLYCLDHYFPHKCLHYADPCFHCTQFQMSREDFLGDGKHREMIVNVFIKVHADVLLKD